MRCRTSQQHQSWHKPHAQRCLHCCVDGFSSTQLSAADAPATVEQIVLLQACMSASHARAHTHAHTYSFTFTYIHTRARTRPNTRTHKHTHTNTCATRMYTHTDTHEHTHEHTHAHGRTCPCIHARIFTGNPSCCPPSHQLLASGSPSKRPQPQLHARAPVHVSKSMHKLQLP